MSSFKITPEMLHNLKYDKNNDEEKKESIGATESNCAPSGLSIMIVLEYSDVNGAIYHLAKSMEKPFAANSIVTLLVQESIRNEFLRNLKTKIPRINEELTKNSAYNEANELVEKLKFLTIKSDDADSLPRVVYDVTHEQLGPAPNGFINMQTFRTVKEAIDLVLKEPTPFVNATIWTMDYAVPFEFVLSLKQTNYYFNCHLMPLDPLKEYIAKKVNHIDFKNSYQYSTFQSQGLTKNVVFPIGTIFAN